MPSVLNKTRPSTNSTRSTHNRTLLQRAGYDAIRVIARTFE